MLAWASLGIWEMVVDQEIVIEEVEVEIEDEITIEITVED